MTTSSSRRPTSTANVDSQTGAAYVYSGEPGSGLPPWPVTLLRQFDGEGAFGQFGGSLSGAGDVDFYADVIIGASCTNSMAGSVYDFSGGSGNLLYKVDGDGPYTMNSTILRTVRRILHEQSIADVFILSLSWAKS